MRVTGGRVSITRAFLKLVQSVARLCPCWYKQPFQPPEPPVGGGPSLSFTHARSPPAPLSVSVPPSVSLSLTHTCCHSLPAKFPIPSLSPTMGKVGKREKWMYLEITRNPTTDALLHGFSWGGLAGIAALSTGSCLLCKLDKRADSNRDCDTHPIPGSQAWFAGTCC